MTPTNTTTPATTTTPTTTATTNYTLQQGKRRKKEEPLRCRGKGGESNTAA